MTGPDARRRFETALSPVEVWEADPDGPVGRGHARRPRPRSVAPYRCEPSTSSSTSGLFVQLVSLLERLL